MINIVYQDRGNWGKTKTNYLHLFYYKPIKSIVFGEIARYKEGGVKIVLPFINRPCCIAIPTIY